MNCMELATMNDVEEFNTNIVKKGLKKLSKINYIIVRFFEILVALIGIMMMLPLTILIKIICIIKKDNDAIFQFDRCIGKNGRVFNLIRFRTINKYGDVNLLQRTGLYNFPKLINVLKGEIKFVGPQPYLENEKQKMGTYYNKLIQIKPGMITGIYDIDVLKNESFLTRMDNDIKYSKNSNLLLDLKIIAITILAKFTRRNKEQLYKYTGYTPKDYINGLRRLVNRFLKRTMDILGGLAGILILFPLTLTVAIIHVFSKDNGPLFYSQKRIGRNGKSFSMYKFRSMIVGADDALVKLLAANPEANEEYKQFKKLKDDPRVTKIGAFLRKTSLDEFPQFLNVLKGEMSLVGPRPYLERESDEMGNYYPVVIKHKPGITGLWQVSGRSDVSFKDRLDLDLEYDNEFSVVNDVKILFKTVINVLKHEGAA